MENKYIKPTENGDVDLRKTLKSEDPAALLENAVPFIKLMNQYECALMEVETKLKVLNKEFSLAYNRNPFESIKTRLKSPVSIIEKMKRKGYELTLNSIEEKLADIAGIRVICSFPEYIYILAELLARQDDIIVLEKADTGAFISFWISRSFYQQGKNI